VHDVEMDQEGVSDGLHVSNQAFLPGAVNFTFRNGCD
jgi:hypothetical protein